MSDKKNISKLQVVQVSDFVQKEVVKELEDLLKEAKEGKIGGIMYVTRLSSEGHNVGACGDWPSCYEMVGVAYSLLQHVSDYVDDGEDY